MENHQNEDVDKSQIGGILLNDKYYIRPNVDLEGYDLIKRVSKIKNDDTEDDIWVATIYEMEEFKEFLKDAFQVYCAASKVCTKMHIKVQYNSIVEIYPKAAEPKDLAAFNFEVIIGDVTASKAIKLTSSNYILQMERVIKAIDKSL